jgi:hypothetical protein
VFWSTGTYIQKSVIINKEFHHFSTYYFKKKKTGEKWVFLPVWYIFIVLLYSYVWFQLVLFICEFLMQSLSCFHYFFLPSVIVTQLVKKFPAFVEFKRFITVFVIRQILRQLNPFQNFTSDLSCIYLIISSQSAQHQEHSFTQGFVCVVVITNRMQICT